MMRTTRKAITVAVAAFLLLLQTNASVAGQPPAEGAVTQGEVSISGVTQPLLQYQGRLTDPGTGAPKPDGVYSMSFRLYDVGSGGSALWIETKDVSVQDGVFSTLLGDVAMLDHDLFSGQELWLGIKVGTDAEAAPRQLVLPVAYALSLVPGARVSAASGDPVLRVENSGAGNALEINGPTVVNGDLTVGGGLVGGSHNHSGANITSGTVADARIASSIARDSEVWGIVTTSDGPGSGLNADVLDGWHATSFATSSHSHSGLLLRTTVLNASCTNLSSFSTTWQKIGNVGSFTKSSSSSDLEITFNGRIYAATMSGTGAAFELRVNDVATTNGRARASIKAAEAGGSGVPVSITGIFTGVGSGTRTVSFWVQGFYGGGTNAYFDPGCWSTDHVVIKEFS